MIEETAYDLVEYRHRFSVWAAGRAAQRGLKGGTVGVLRDALEQSGVVAFAKSAKLPVHQVDYDEAHREWCRSIISYLAHRNVHASFGRAAKLIAIYLKSMVILDGRAEKNQARAVHPPLDAILLGNMCKASDVRLTHKTAWRKVKWTALSEDEYYILIDQLRTCIAHGEPFWTIERFWTVTEIKIKGPLFWTAGQGWKAIRGDRVGTDAERVRAAEGYPNLRRRRLSNR